MNGPGPGAARVWSAVIGRWANRQLKSASQRDTRNGPIWVIVYHNPGEPDATHATVYIFFDVLGNYLGANFTGPPQ